MMADANWTHLGSPGDVVFARISPDGATIAAGSAAGRLYLRRQVGDGWRWQAVGVPPGSFEVADAVALPGDPLSVAVVGGPTLESDVRVWLHQPDTPGSWTPLGGPVQLEPDRPQWADSGHLAVASVRRGAALHHTFVVTSSGQRLPWIRSGIDPDGIWFPLAIDVDRPVKSIAAAVAGDDLQPHIFTVFDNPPGVPGVTLRVAIRENATWIWQDLVVLTSGDTQNAPVSAVAVRDDSGRQLAYGLLGVTTAEAAAHLVLGSGRTWQKLDLGTLPDGVRLDSPVAAGSHPTDLTVLGRHRHDAWTRTPPAPWVSQGTTPGDVAVVVPNSAVMVTDGAARAVRVAGVSWDSDLWTLQTGGTAPAWLDHGHPGAVTAVVGTYRGPQANPDPEPTAVTFALDEDGEFWQVEIFGEAGEGLFQETSSWNHHGRPTPEVSIRATVGVFAVASIRPQPAWAFVVGSDGHLWSRESVAVEGWSWADHGAPEGTSVQSAVAPVDVGSRPAVHALARDGHLWMRARVNGQWQWIDRDTPQGQLIFAVVGATNLPAVPVVTGAGQLWINVPDGAGFRWASLGTPTPAEKVIAGVGVTQVLPNAVDIAVMGASGEVWNRRWATDNSGQWTPLGQPGDLAITAAVGVGVGPPGAVVAVVAGDRLWLTTPAGGPWTPYDHPDGTTTVLSGRTTTVFDRFAATVIDGTRRMQIAIPAPL
jgi:hypothetical protein